MNKNIQMIQPIIVLHLIWISMPPLMTGVLQNNKDMYQPETFNRFSKYKK
jgi:hypothetical protein